MNKVYFLLVVIVCTFKAYSQSASSVPGKLQSFNYFKNWLVLTPESVALADNSYSYTSLIKSSGFSDGLNMQEFNFSIPSEATITSIVLNLRKFKKGQTDVRDAAVFLITQAGENNYEASYGPGLPKTTENWPSLATDILYTWAGSGSYKSADNKTVYYQWTPARVNNSFFGANFQAKLQRGGSGATVYLDKVSITVNYTITSAARIKTEQSQTREIGNVPSLNVQVSNNPSTAEFSIKPVSATASPITLRITDASGKLIEVRYNVASNTLYKIGSNYKKGLYIAELQQGNQRKIVKLVKN